MDFSAPEQPENFEGLIEPIQKLEHFHSRNDPLHILHPHVHADDDLLERYNSLGETPSALNIQTNAINKSLNDIENIEKKAIAMTENITSKGHFFDQRGFINEKRSDNIPMKTNEPIPSQKSSVRREPSQDARDSLMGTP